jgi:hypothetical protein
MIKITVHESLNDISLCCGKRTFTKGVNYYGRRSLSGDQYLVRCNEGYWIPFIWWNWTRTNKEYFSKYFDYVDHFYLNNKKEINNL